MVWPWPACRRFCDTEFSLSGYFNSRVALETKAMKTLAKHADQAKIDDLCNLLVPFEKGPLSAKVFSENKRSFLRHYFGKFWKYICLLDL